MSDESQLRLVAAGPEPWSLERAWRLRWDGAQYAEIAAHFQLGKSTVWRRMHPSPPTLAKRVADLERRVGELERLAAVGRVPAQDPPCPYCGMTSQVEPSRSEPGRWMCHGCADTFDAPLRVPAQEDKP